jgi:hypothetical protein
VRSVSIEWLRDLVIVIFGIASTIVVIMLAIVAYKLYKKVLPVLASVKSTAKTAEDISSCVRDTIVTPLAFFASFSQGLAQALKLFGRFTGRKEGS